MKDDAESHALTAGDGADPMSHGDAMVSALKKGTLAGAGLDVTDPEPLPPEHPLWTFENVVLTPHMGGTSDRVWERRMELLRENLKRFVAGESLRNVVDKQREY